MYTKTILGLILVGFLLFGCLGPAALSKGDLLNCKKGTYVPSEEIKQKMDQSGVTVKTIKIYGWATQNEGTNSEFDMCTLRMEFEKPKLVMGTEISGLSCEFWGLFKNPIEGYEDETPEEVFDETFQCSPS